MNINVMSLKGLVSYKIFAFVFVNFSYKWTLEDRELGVFLYYKQHFTLNIVSTNKQMYAFSH